MQKGPLSKEMHALHSERVKSGQARARTAGRVIGRPGRYPMMLIGDAIERHTRGETWAAIAASLGISEPWLYARVRQLRSAAQHD